MYVCASVMREGCPCLESAGLKCNCSDPDECEYAVLVEDPSDYKVLIFNDESGDHWFEKSILFALEQIEAQCNDSSWLSPDCFSLYEVLTHGLVEQEIKYSERKRYSIDYSTVKL